MADYTVNKSQIADAIRNLDRKKDDQERVDTSDRSLKISAGLGSHTPTTLLADIRGCILEMSKEVRENTALVSQMMQQSKAQHLEQLAFLSKIADNISSARRGDSVSAQVSAPGTPQSTTREFYYNNEKVGSSNTAVACILVQLDSLIKRSAPAQQDLTSDATDMELKDWANVVQMVCSAGGLASDDTHQITLPKFKSSTTADALSIVATTTRGRIPAFSTEQLRQLVTTCQPMASAVEEVRIRIIACPGLVGMIRHSRLSSTAYPFLTSTGDLDMVRDASARTYSRDHFVRVFKLKQVKKKTYVAGILRETKKPSAALMLAED